MSSFSILGRRICSFSNFRPAAPPGAAAFFILPYLVSKAYFFTCLCCVAALKGGGKKGCHFFFFSCVNASHRRPATLPPGLCQRDREKHVKKKQDISDKEAVLTDINCLTGLCPVAAFPSTTRRIHNKQGRFFSFSSSSSSSSSSSRFPGKRRGAGKHLPPRKISPPNQVQWDSLICACSRKIKELLTTEERAS